MPVALDLGKIHAAQDESGQFFRAIYAQTLNKQYQGLWLVDPDGRLLANIQRPDPAAVLSCLNSGLMKYGTVAPRGATPTNARPYRGIGVRPDGGVILGVTDKITFLDLTRHRPLNANPRVFLDIVTLSADEWAAMAPPEARPGTRWSIPDEVGRRFFPLLSLTDAVYRRPEEVTEVQLVGRVKSVRDGIAYLVYAGRIAGSHHGTRKEGRGDKEYASMLRMVGGVGAYEIEAGQMLSLTWVWDGMFGMGSPSNPPKPRLIPTNLGDSNRYGVVVEWRRGDSGPAFARAVKASTPRPNGEVVDSTPEAALKAFLLALAAQDEAMLRAVALPDTPLDRLLRERPAPPELLAQLEARLEEKPMRRLKVGDPVRMPDGELRTIQPDDVRDGRVVLWPEGEPLPARLELVDGHWKVFAGTSILLRGRSAAGIPDRIHPEPSHRSRGVDH